MRYAVIAPDGRLGLGDQAERLGFVAGAVIEIVPTSAGSLLLVLDHSPPVVDATWRPLTGGAAQKALRDRASVAEEGRDAHLMRLSTCAEENAIRRRLLLEARETIARLERQVAAGAMSDGR